MDYFETINSSKETELAYASWYAAQSDQRKAKMLSDLVQFGVDTVRYNTRKANPFITGDEQMLAYIQSNLKSEFTPETFAFIEAKMAERSEREWQNRFKAMKKALGWSYDDMARYIGASSGNSIKASINRQLPAFAKLAVCVFEQLGKNAEQQTPSKENP